MDGQNRVYCLYRVSTNKQVDHDEQNRADIPVQRKACQEFAQKMGWNIVREEQENGVSGFKISADNRDKIQLFKEHAQKGLFDILLVFMFDRLGRRSDETPFVVEWFVQHGIRVWSVNEGEQRFESHTDRLTNYIRFWQADGESQKTAIRTKTALGQMVQEGRFRGGTAPYGYRLEKSGVLNKRKHEVNELVIDEEEARIVRLVFDLCIGAGYGKWKIANFFKEKGILNRSGNNWHEATIGHMLSNVMYKGVLRSGDTYSEPFENLQIIAPERFDLAQKIIQERKLKNHGNNTKPLYTSGQSLLSGNIFCGHCGGRLTLTTSGKTQRTADGTPLQKKRIRYSCYNKTRHRKECDGQTGYTMHIVDDMVRQTLYHVFDKMKAVPKDIIVDGAIKKNRGILNDELKRAKGENTKLNKEYESLKAEVMKSIQGKSALPSDVLNEMLTEVRQKLVESSEHIASLSVELEAQNIQIKETQKEYERIIGWSEIFDKSSIEVQKMICSAIIDKVSVYRGYRIDIQFNISLEQFLNGIDLVNAEDQNLSSEHVNYDQMAAFVL